MKGTQLFIEYPFGGKQYEYRCHILKELAIGLVQGRPSITNIHKKFEAIDSVSSKDVETEVNGFVNLALNYAAEYKAKGGNFLNNLPGSSTFLTSIIAESSQRRLQRRNESMKIRDPLLQVYWKKMIICIGASLVTMIYW